MDNDMKLESEEPPFCGFAKLSQPFKGLVARNPFGMIDNQRRCLETEENIVKPPTK